MTVDWGKLPAEILLKIFRVDCEYTLNAEFALVCRGWLLPAQAILYSEIIFYSLSRLKKFHDLVQLRPEFGEKVKKITMGHFSEFTPEQERKVIREQVLDLYSNLLSGGLPNLKEIDDVKLKSYSTIQHALLESHLSHLENVSWPESIEEPYRYELASFATCASLLKNRLKKLGFSELLTYSQNLDLKRLYFDRLYSTLHQFQMLTELNITISTLDGTRELEYITKSCKSLESLIFDMRTYPPANNNSTITEKEILAFTPSYNIKKLCATLYTAEDCKQIKYIIHKFQRLQKLELCMAEGPGRLDQHKLSQLLEFSSIIKEFDLINLFVDDNPIWETLEGHLNSNAKSNNVALCICHDFDPPDDFLYTFGFHNRGSFDATINLRYYEMAEESHHFALLKKLGERITDLSYTSTRRDTEIHGWAKYSIPNEITYCTNLKNLSFRDGVVKPFDPHGIRDYDKSTLFLEKLSLLSCILIDGAYEQLSSLLPNIKLLDLNLVSQLGSEDDVWDYHYEDSMPRIDMPNSKVEMIDFVLVGSDFYYLKLVSLSDDEEYFYQIDDGLKTQSTIESYLAANEDQRAHIRTETHIQELIVWE